MVFEHFMTGPFPENFILTGEIMRAFQCDYVPTLWDHAGNPLLVILRHLTEAPPTTGAPNLNDPGHATASMRFLMGMLGSPEPTFVGAALRPSARLALKFRGPPTDADPRGPLEEDFRAGQCTVYNISPVLTALFRSFMFIRVNERSGHGNFRSLARQPLTHCAFHPAGKHRRENARNTGPAVRENVSRAIEERDLQTRIGPADLGFWSVHQFLPFKTDHQQNKEHAPEKELAYPVFCWRHVPNGTNR
jgi:hypothetical protein